MTAPDIAPIRARLLAATWQPIETAPDGMPVLVRGGWRKDRAEIVEADGDWWRHGAGRVSAQPTEWRPLPSDEHDTDLAALLAHVDEQAAEIERLRAELERAQAKKGWRCFHCDEVFTDERCARDHFGRSEMSEPACVIKMGAERSLLTALRRVEGDCNEMMDRLQSDSTDAAKAYFAQAARHQEQLRIAEELGFERGIAELAALTAAAEGVRAAALEEAANAVETTLERSSSMSAAYRAREFCRAHWAAAIRALAPHPPTPEA